MRRIEKGDKVKLRQKWIRQFTEDKQPLLKELEGEVLQVVHDMYESRNWFKKPCDISLVHVWWNIGEATLEWACNLQTIDLPAANKLH